MAQILITTTYTCLNCDPEKILEHQEMMDHLRTVHDVDPKATQARKEGLQFLDMGGGQYSNTFRFTVGNLKFMKYVNARKIQKDQ